MAEKSGLLYHKQIYNDSSLTLPLIEQVHYEPTTYILQRIV